jgi:3-oxoacyl-[acyl-carrier protein] reductase
MDFGIAGRRALIAGSSSGIGTAIAVALAREGVRVVVHGRSAAGAEAVAVAANIREAGGEASVVLGELGDASTVERIAREAMAAFGGIDILVNSAGASDHFDLWRDTSLETWERQYRLSVLYAIQLIQLIAPSMQAAGWGRIINLGSAIVFHPGGHAPDYTAAKAALQGVTPGYARDLGPYGVTVNTLCSGTVLTDNTERVMISHARALGLTEEGAALERRVAKEVWPNSIGRLGRPEEIAAAACFLASEQAAFVTGATLRADGCAGDA